MCIARDVSQKAVYQRNVTDEYVYKFYVCLIVIILFVVYLRALFWTFKMMFIFIAFVRYFKVSY